MTRVAIITMGATGGLRMLKQYPVGKGANWVEIVSFD
jgi:hypothetical protein